MPPLTGLDIFIGFAIYKDVAPDGACGLTAKRALAVSRY
jgi:hypothetical protein